MTAWQSIATAPKDGSTIRVRQNYDGRVSFETLAAWRTVHFPAMPSDPLGRGNLPGAEAYTATGWMMPDKNLRVPEPNEWLPAHNHAGETPAVHINITGDTSAALFHRAGVALFGDLYIAPLAHALRCGKETVRKMAAGKSYIPLGVWGDVYEFIEARRETLDGISPHVRDKILPTLDQ